MGTEKQARDKGILFSSAKPCHICQRLCASTTEDISAFHKIQEESCIRIASFLSDGIVVEPRVVLPNTSLNAMYFSLKEFDLIVPVTMAMVEEDQDNGEEQGFMLMITQSSQTKQLGM
jgi:hypothetical protein